MQQRIEQLINNKTYLLIDSSKRTSGTAEQFLYTLPDLVTGVKSIRPVYCILSNSAYNIGSQQNTFSIDRSGLTLTQAIPVGTYSEANLIDALNLIWNPLNIDFSYDPNTLKVTILDTTSTPFKLNKELCTVRTALGFTASYEYNSEQIQHDSDSIVRLSNVYDWINVNIDVVQQYFGLELKNYLVSVPLQNITFGSTQMITFPDGLSIVASKSFFNQINVTLTDKEFNVISNNNSDWLLLLEVFYL